MPVSIVNLGDGATGRALHEAAAASAGEFRVVDAVAGADVLVCTVGGSASLADAGDAHRRAPEAQLVLRVPDAEVERLRTQLSFVPDIAGAWVVPASITPEALAEVLRRAGATSANRRELHALRKSLNRQMSGKGNAAPNGAEYQRERQLARSERYRAMLFAQAPQAFLALTLDGEIAAWNTAAERISGVPAPAALGRRLAEVVPPKTAEALLQLAAQTRERGTVSAPEMQLAFAPATIWAQLNAAPVHDEDDIRCISITLRDATERHRMEAQARASAARYRTLVGALPQLVWTARPDGTVDWCSPQWIAYTGIDAAAAPGESWLAVIHPDDRARVAAHWQGAITQRHDYDTEYRLRGTGGRYRWFKARAIALRDDEGNIDQWFGTSTDIDELVRAREILERSTEQLEQAVQDAVRRRAKAEEALHRAQKMEALGSLTGGIAHDFNNILQVVGGNLHLLATLLTGNPDAQRRIAAALEGVAQGSTLASQLLAFGRRLPLSPKVVNIGRLVREMDDMLRRTLGERVELETSIAGGLWNTLVDRSNIESALLNLAINARDAMNGEGKLTVEVGNAFLDDDYAAANEEVVPGQYVMLAVTDTGCGMAPEVAEKVFEPFFSTKPEGKGTGLGLSMVYGFVKQSRGHVNIYTEIGHGTTFKIYLPRSQESEDIPVATEAHPVRGGSETILVVEDDDAVRTLAVATLTELGYTALQARDALAALAIIESGAPVDVLFTDVVMPGPLKSPELARKARERLPHLAVLYTSGYTRNAIVHGGRLDEGVELLGKPYSREALARKLRHVLASGSQQPAANASTASTAGEATERERRRVVLLCDDERLVRATVGELLKALGYDVLLAASGAEALRLAAENSFDVLVTDVRLPDVSGLDVARQVLRLKTECPVLLASGEREALPPDLADARFILKPFSAATLRDAIESLLVARTA